VRRREVKPVWSVAPPDADGWTEVEGYPLTGAAQERLRVRVVDGDIRELHVRDNGEPITGTRLRALQPGTIALMVETLGAFGEQPKAPWPTSPPERGHGDDHYERVAATYRRAIAEGHPPVAQLVAEARVPRSTAARWVKEARRRGMLKPTRQGQKRG